MRRAAGAALALLALAPGMARAAAPDPLAALKASCQTRISADKPPRRAARYRICTAPVASFDGTKLDATLTLPEGPHGRLPLVVFLHGFLNTKAEQLSLTRPATVRTRAARSTRPCAGTTSGWPIAGTPS